MKITLKVYKLFEALVTLGKETCYGMTDQSKDLVLINTCQDCVYFTASSKYSSLCRTFRTPESHFKETCLVGLKELTSVIEKFAETIGPEVSLVLSQQQLKVEVEHHSPVFIPCRNLDLWPHKTIRLDPVFRQPKVFHSWLNDAWQFVRYGDTGSSQGAKIWLTSQGIIASREKAFLHIPFNCSIRTPVFLSPPSVFF